MDNFRKLLEKYQNFQKFNYFHSKCPELKKRYMKLFLVLEDFLITESVHLHNSGNDAVSLTQPKHSDARRTQ